jgi:hypothetical protein
MISSEIFHDPKLRINAIVVAEYVQVRLLVDEMVSNPVNRFDGFELFALEAVAFRR